MTLAGVLVFQIDFVVHPVDGEGSLKTVPVDVVDECDNYLAPEFPDLSRLLVGAGGTLLAAAAHRGDRPGNLSFPQFTSAPELSGVHGAAESNVKRRAQRDRRQEGGRFRAPYGEVHIRESAV